MLAARRASSLLFRARPTSNTLHVRAPTTQAPPPSSRPPTAPGAPPLRPSPSSPPPPQLPSAAGAAAAPLTIGLASGTLGAMCGLGGAIFAIPALMRYHALAQPAAAGTALVAVTAVSIAGTTVFGRSDAVHLNVAAPLSLAAAVSTPVGAALAVRVSPPVLRRALAVFMIGLSPALFLRDMLANRTPTDDTTCARESSLATAGVAIGALSGLLGISGGSLFTPVIALAYPSLPFRDVVGTSFAAMILPTGIAALTYARAGHLARPLAPMLVAGAAAGAAIGSQLALTVPDKVLRNVFATVVAVLGLRMFRAPVNLPRK